MTPNATQDRSALIAAAVARLQHAADARTPCPPVRDLIGTHDANLAYAVQHQLAAARRAAGAQVIGHKIGLTATAVQAQVGVDRPDFGLLFDDMDASGAPVDSARLLQPKIEAEIAFVLAAGITDPDATAETVRGAVAYALPALEIVDSRIAGWDISLGDTVADNASSGLFVLGTQRTSLDEFTPREVRMSMICNGDVLSTGTGTDCLGDPLNALAWLARTAVEIGDPLQAGHVVLSGALGPMVTVDPGSTYEAVISGLGTVVAVFTAGGSATTGEEQ